MIGCTPRFHIENCMKMMPKVQQQEIYLNKGYISKLKVFRYVELLVKSPREGSGSVGKANFQEALVLEQFGEVFVFQHVSQKPKNLESLVLRHFKGLLKVSQLGDKFREGLL